MSEHETPVPRPGSAQVATPDAAGPRYAVVSTVKDEAEYIASVAESLIAQSIPPAEWVVVDDGSTDETTAIVAGYAARHPWIRVVQLGQLDGWNRCGRITRAFVRAYQSVQGEYGFIANVDGDVSLSPEYMERLLRHFGSDSSLGIASGTFAECIGGKWKVHRMPDGHAVNAARMYRSECLRATFDMAAEAGLFDGLSTADKLSAPGQAGANVSWDSVDYVYAEAAGWTTRCFDELVILHHRPEGGRHHLLRGRFEQGLAAHALGYHPVYALGRAVRSVGDYPYGAGAVSWLAGYVRGVLDPACSVVDETTKRLVRERQASTIRRFAAGDHRGDVK